MDENLKNEIEQLKLRVAKLEKQLQSSCRGCDSDDDSCSDECDEEDSEDDVSEKEDSENYIG